MLRRLSVLTAVVAALTCTAEAKDRPVSVGPYAQVDIGGKAMLGKNESHAAMGPTMALHIGIDLFQWLSVGGKLNLASHEATVPAPPEGEYTQLYGALGEARLSIAIKQVSVYAEGALGYSAISTNVLEKVRILDPGERFSPTIGAGGGLEYQLQNRHYAFGVGGEWTLYAGFSNLQTASAHAYLRYTY